MDLGAYGAVLAEQCGVISRAQLLACGAMDHDAARLIRRRDLVAVHRGVYVNHTGQLLWAQRAWAGVLVCWPAALSHSSAIRATEGPGRRLSPDSEIHVAIDRHRHVVSPNGVVLHRVADFADQVLWNLGPPRVRYEHAILDVAAEQSSDLAAVGVLAEACGSRRTTAARLLTRLDGRANLARRKWLIDVLYDIAAGSCSVLEHGFLHRVVKAHGLPIPERQVPESVGSSVRYRDALWPDGLAVELDGRLFHDSAQQRDRDFDRDLDAATVGLASVRLSYGQVFERPCSTAKRLTQVLLRAGIAVYPHSCAPDCASQSGAAGDFVYWVNGINRSPCPNLQTKAPRVGSAGEGPTNGSWQRAKVSATPARPTNRLGERPPWRMPHDQVGCPAWPARTKWLASCRASRRCSGADEGQASAANRCISITPPSP